MKKFLFLFSLIIGQFCFSLQFGSIGSQAFGMAGTGVAIENSAYSPYFNPALIASSGFFKFGASIDITGKSNNFLEILNKNFKNLTKEQAEALLKMTENTSMYIENRNGVYMSFNGPLGALGVGATLNAFGYANLNLKNNLKSIDSIKNAQFEINSKFVEYMMLEIPITYAYMFDTIAGDISIGVSGSYIGINKNYGYFDLTSINHSVHSMTNIDFKNVESNYGIHLGVFYKPLDYVGFGLSGKYLNSPKFQFNDEILIIDPQVRFGTSLDFDIITLGLDVDLTKNKFITHDFYNQLISVGMLVDLKFLSLKGGVSKDLLHPEDLIFSAGISLTVFDIGVQFGKKSVPVYSYKVPTYFGINIGAGFSF